MLSTCYLKSLHFVLNSLPWVEVVHVFIEGPLE